jgi:hypothetical protein
MWLEETCLRKRKKSRTSVRPILVVVITIRSTYYSYQCVQKVYTQSERKLSHGLSILLFLVKNERGAADCCLETNLPSVRRGQYLVDRQTTLRGISNGTASIPVRYCMIFSTVVITQLQLWHFHLLALHVLWETSMNKSRRRWTPSFTGTLLQSSKYLSHLNDIARIIQRRGHCFKTNPTITGTKSKSVYFVYVPVPLN